MASKSADAYREAQAKGVKIGGDGHHEHGAATTTASPATAIDHAAHGAAPATHAGHETSTQTTSHDQHGGMQHGTTQQAADPHAQHRQSPTPQADPHAGHAMTAPAPHAAHSPVPTVAPPSNIDVRRVDPASTLRPDAFDAPAPASVSEAAKASQGGGHEGHGKDH